MSLSVVVIHYRTPLLLEHCLKRLRAYAPEAAVTVVDTGDAKETSRLLSRFREVSLLEADNHSLAHAVNAGLASCSARVVAHMNADVFIGRDTFPHLLNAIAEPGTGMAGPLSHDLGGRVQDQGLPYRWHSLLVERLPLGASRPVPWLAGNLHLIRTEALERVGGMDESLRFYNEDIDWSCRFRRAGYSCRLVNTPVLHVGGSATPSEPRFLLEGLRGGYVLSQRYRPPWFQALHRRAVLLYARYKQKTSPQEAATYARLESMFRRGSFDKSPFGRTLSEDNPEFI